MTHSIVIEPMGESFVLWRCLHSGPLSMASIDQPPLDVNIDWQALRSRNMPLLTKLQQLYGAYAIVARDRDCIVGQLRFYPKAICQRTEAGGLCLQQTYPAGPMQG